MRITSFPCLSFLLISCTVMSTAQTTLASSDLNSQGLTQDQINIYRTVIADYLGKSSGKLNIRSTTELPDEEHPFYDDKCAQRIEPEKLKVSSAHNLNSVVEGHPNWLLVDGDKQEQLVDSNDPQKLIKSAIDDHQKVTEAELDDSIKRAFETGLFTLSEIAFDKQHQRAAVAYSFVCGGLCGNGDTLILHKTGGKWKIVKRCGGWVS